MFAILHIPAGQSATTIIDNLKKLATGTTDKTQLDFGGNADALANSVIIADVPAGFTAHSIDYSDATSATQASTVLKAPWHLSNVTVRNLDVVNKSQYKFVDIRISGGNLMLLPGDDYTTGNPTESPNAFPSYMAVKQPIDRANGCYLIVSINPQKIYLKAYTAANGFGSSPFGQASWVFERERGLGWDTPAANFSPLVVPTDTALGFLVNPWVAGGKINGYNSGYTQCGRPYVSGAEGVRPFKVMNADGTILHLLREFGISALREGENFVGGGISKICETYIGTSDIGAQLDTMTLDGKTYFLDVISPDGLGAGIRIWNRMG